MGRILARLAAGGIVAVLAVSLSAPAWAVQTSTFGLNASDPGRPAADYLRLTSGSGSDEAVVVNNRTETPVVVTLQVVGVERRGGSYQLGAAGQGLAADVHLGRSHLTLSPGQSVRVPVSAAGWKGQQSWAAITAEQNALTNAGSLSVAERLAVLVEAVGPAPALRVAGLPLPWAIAAAVLLALVAAALAYHARRGRRLPVIP